MINKIQEDNRSKYHRVLPISELFVDRCKKARGLGWGKGTSVYDSCIIFGDVQVGEHTWIGPNAILDGSGGGIEIGDYCDIGAEVHLYTHDSLKRCLSGGTHPMEYGEIKIGSNCMIEPQCIIAKGVKIGDRCVIAANSFVNRSFGDNSIIAGNPAKKIGRVVIRDENVYLEYEK